MDYIVVHAVPLCAVCPWGLQSPEIPPPLKSLLSYAWILARWLYSNFISSFYCYKISMQRAGNDVACSCPHYHGAWLPGKIRWRKSNQSGNLFIIIVKSTCWSRINFKIEISQLRIILIIQNINVLMSLIGGVMHCI